jgi:MFS-type transporter involved in bile tolerance (Atg22 family)
VLLALTTGHKIGLLVFGAIFVVFALVSAMVIPRFRPRFPGRGLPFFVLAAVGLTVAMLTAVVVFGREGKEAKGGENVTEATTTTTGGGGKPTAPA